jgi:hypothetical protein
MTELAGISVRKNEEGKVTHLIFEVDKHQDFLQPVLNNLGIIEKTKFRQDFDNAMTAEEVRTSIYKTIDHLFDAKEKSKV